MEPKAGTILYLYRPVLEGSHVYVMLGYRLSLQWAMGRLFDLETAQLYQHLVAQAGNLRVTSVSEQEQRRHRPHGQLKPPTPPPFGPFAGL